LQHGFTGGEKKRLTTAASEELDARIRLPVIGLKA
jgi:hypothetical protein